MKRVFENKNGEIVYHVERVRNGCGPDCSILLENKETGTRFVVREDIFNTLYKEIDGDVEAEYKATFSVKHADERQDNITVKVSFDPAINGQEQYDALPEEEKSLAGMVNNLAGAIMNHLNGTLDAPVEDGECCGGNVNGCGCE